MTDFRALCAELLQALETEGYAHWTQAPDEDELCLRARAALAEAYEAEANNPPEGHPDPEPFQAILRDRAAALAQPEPQGSGPTNQELVNVWEDCKHAEPDPSFPKPLIFAHAVLARWGRPAIEPVPVAERLPEPKDCDAEGRCWFGAPGSHVMAANWVYRKMGGCRSWDTHWLPHHALPVPQQEAGQ